MFVFVKSLAAKVLAHLVNLDGAYRPFGMQKQVLRATEGAWRLCHEIGADHVDRG